MWTEMIRSKVSKCQISCFISTLSPIFDTRDFIILLVGKWTTLITALKIVKREVVRFCCLFISLFWTALLAISVLRFVPVSTWFIISCFSIYNNTLSQTLHQHDQAPCEILSKTSSFLFFYGNWFSFMIWISATKQFLNQGLHSPIMYCPANFSKHAVSALGHLNKLSFSNITYLASFFFLPKSMQFLHWALYYISNFILISSCKFFSVWPSITALTRTNAPLLAWQWVSLLPNTTGFILIGLPHRHFLWSIFFSRNIC